MIVTGALRSVAVKLLYQIGLSAPFFVTLLYLSGQSLSLVVHFVGRRLGIVKERPHVQQEAHSCNSTSAHDSGGEFEMETKVAALTNGTKGYVAVDSEAGEETFE